MNVGLHTNGYSLVRLMMDKMPQIKLDKVDGLTFVEQIMKPHTPYYKSIKGLFDKEIIHGMTHITGGGIEGNLCRIIPNGLSAKIDLSKLKILNIFKYIKITEISAMKKCCAHLIVVWDSML